MSTPRVLAYEDSFALVLCGTVAKICQNRGRYPTGQGVVTHRNRRDPYPSLHHHIAAPQLLGYPAFQWALTDYS